MPVEGLEVLDTNYSSSNSEDCEPCKNGLPCENEDSSDLEEGNNLYQIISQFQEINVLNNDNIIEILKSVKDPEIRSKILDLLGEKESPNTQLSNTRPFFKLPTTEEAPSPFQQL